MVLTIPDSKPPLTYIPASTKGIIRSSSITILSIIIRNDYNNIIHLFKRTYKWIIPRSKIYTKMTVGNILQLHFIAPVVER